MCLYLFRRTHFGFSPRTVAAASILFMARAFTASAAGILAKMLLESVRCMLARERLVSRGGNE